MFSTELELVDYSLAFLIEEFEEHGEKASYIQEPKGLFGIPDVIIYNGNVIAIEYKLKNWKQAMKQAYRYQSFSYETYVVLDNYYIENAKNNLSMFEKFNIGLCAVEKGNIKFYFKPKKKKPYSINLSQKAMDLFLV